VQQRDAADEQRRRTRAALDDMLSDESLAFLTTQKELLPPQRAFLERVLEYYREFAARAATDEEGRKLVGRAQFRVGRIYDTLGQRAEAEAEYRKALALKEKLAADFPAVPVHRRDLAVTHNNLGALLRNQGKRAEAEAEYRGALALYERLAADFPAVPVHRGRLALIHNNLGNMLSDRGKGTEAEAEYRKALALQEKLATDFPAVPAYTVDLAGSYLSLGKFVRDRGEPAAALNWYAKAIATVGPVHGADPRFVPARQVLRNSHWGRALALDRLGRPVEALADWERALELDDGSARTTLRLGRARTLTRAGDAAKALAAADELAAAADLTAAQLYDRACVYALAAGGKLPPADAARAAARAVALMRQAVAQGYRAIPKLLADADLAALRCRADYAELLWDLADRPVP
jgi:tetratricopeptide (TPR) repeat protein